MNRKRLSVKKAARMEQARKCTINSGLQKCAGRVVMTKL